MKPVRPPSTALGAAHVAGTTSPLVWAVTPLGPNTPNTRTSVPGVAVVRSAGGPPASAPSVGGTDGRARSLELNQPLATSEASDSKRAPTTRRYSWLGLYERMARMTPSRVSSVRSWAAAQR
jgi:hypothetical protein